MKLFNFADLKNIQWNAPLKVRTIIQLSRGKVMSNMHMNSLTLIYYHH